MELTAARWQSNRRHGWILAPSPGPEAERKLHRPLVKAGITGWKANRPVVLDDFTCYVDVIFHKIKLALEIDGRLFHTGAEAFETDRWRQNQLVLNGWCVLRFTWTMIEERPETVLRWSARRSRC
jgi:very-short-patch-repair endonuclease